MNYNKEIIRFFKKHKIIQAHDNVVYCQHLFSMMPALTEALKEKKNIDPKELDKFLMAAYHKYYKWYENIQKPKQDGV